MKKIIIEDKVVVEVEDLSRDAILNALEEAHDQIEFERGKASRQMRRELDKLSALFNKCREVWEVKISNLEAQMRKHDEIVQHIANGGHIAARDLREDKQ